MLILNKLNFTFSLKFPFSPETEVVNFFLSLTCIKVTSLMYPRACVVLLYAHVCRPTVLLLGVF